jgi:hypothetical protein
MLSTLITIFFTKPSLRENPKIKPLSAARQVGSLEVLTIVDGCVLVLVVKKHPLGRRFGF